MSQAVKDNLSFIGVCLIIIAALIIISVLYERFLMKERKKLSNTHYVTYVAIFSALAGVLMLFEIPLFFAPVFYKIDLIGMLVGTLVMTIFGSLFNAVYLLPKFAALYGMPLDAIIGMGTQVNSRITNVSTLVLFAVVPFNLIKGVVDSILTGLLYKRISPILHKGDAKKIEHKEKKV